MRTRLSAFALLALITATISCATPEAEGTLYGEELTLTETTEVADILADPEAFLGQRVLVEATVVNVCEMRGCWLELASEDELGEIFVDCEVGAVPPLGRAYGIPMVYDEGLTSLANVYFEGGDHEDLVYMGGAEFMLLLGDSPHSKFAAPV